jgi:glycosyltransferase involved in cell wall biosynthesis
MLDSMKIAIIWEQKEWGGVDSYLCYMIDNWPNDHDSFVIFYNKENKGAVRLKNILKNNVDVSFKEIRSSFRYKDCVNILDVLLKIIAYLMTPLLFLHSIRMYSKIFKSEKFDVVMAQNGGYPGSYGVLSSLFGASKAGVTVKTLVVHHAATKPDFLHNSFRLIMEKKLSIILSSVISVSNVTKETLLRNTRIFDDQNCYVTVIDNGIPIDNIRNDLVDGKLIKSSGIISANKKIKIGILGRLESYKGHDDFLCALSLVSDECRDKISVDIIGSYNQNDYERLMQIIENLGLQEIVNIRGYVDLSVQEIISQLDLVAMVTKTFEGFALTVVEALHQNVPVLATKVGVVPEIFSDGNDLLVDVGDYSDIARAIELFVNTSDKNIFISDEVKKKLSRYDSKYMALRYHQHLMFECLKNSNIEYV